MPPLSWLPSILLPLEFAFSLVVIAIILVRGRSRTSARLTWIVLILVLPLVGFLLYLLVGEVRLSSRRSRRHREIVDRIERSPRRRADHAAQAPLALPAAYEHLAILGESVGRNVPRAGNRLQLIGDTDLFIHGLVEDIEAAHSHCHLLFYIYLDDYSGRRLAEALMSAARRGVRCRLLVDAVGSKHFCRSPLRATMEDAGVEVVEALPANPLRMLLARIDLRNHRKIAVIDGAIGYAGSHNVADAEFAIKRRYAPWVDATVRVAGPITRDLQALFVEDWYLSTDESLEQVLDLQPQVDPDGIAAQVMGTGPAAHNEALRQLAVAAMHTVREELIITTPYFVPDEATANAMRTVAQRGVRTALVVPARNDSPLVAAVSRAEYGPLLDAGVEIHEYHQGLLHAKTMTIDRSLALLSSANLDRRSFELNLEVSLLIYDSDFASELRFLQRGYMQHSTPVRPVEWSRRSWRARLVQNALGTLGPLL